jgi:hypothetical protein
MWGRMCEAAGDKLANAPGQPSAHLSGKLAVGRFYAERMLPETALLLARIKTGAARRWPCPTRRSEHGQRRIARPRGDGVRRRDRRRRPRGLAAAIRLKQIDPALQVVLVEKGSEVGAHILSER